eukprot:1469045-Pyramimonas_sp.AAC.2
MTFRRSIGATDVFVRAPAPAPARNCRSVRKGRSSPDRVLRLVSEALGTINPVLKLLEAPGPTLGRTLKPRQKEEWSLLRKARVEQPLQNRPLNLVHTSHYQPCYRCRKIVVEFSSTVVRSRSLRRWSHLRRQGAPCRSGRARDNSTL